MRTTTLAASMLAAAMILGIVASRGILRAAEGAQLKVIATSDQSVPGMSGVTFGQIFPEGSSTLGQVLFRSTLAGNGITTSIDNAFWVSDSTGIHTWFREGDPAPGLASGVTFLDPPTRSPFNRSGKVTFYAKVQGPGISGSNDEHVWSGMPGSLSLMASEGPLASGGRFTTLPQGGGIIGDSGNSSFVAIHAGETGQSLWLARDGTFSRLLRSTDPAPGSSGAFGDLTSMRLRDDDGVLFQTATGIWLKPADSSPAAKVVVEGDAAPGTVDGAVISQIMSTLIDSTGAGGTVFDANLEGTGVTSSNNTGLYFGAPGNLAKLARRGEQVPGLQPGIFYGATPAARVNHGGRVAFEAFLTGNTDISNDVAILTGLSGDLQVVARMGDQAPGAGTFFRALGVPAINDSGDVTFFALLGPGGITTSEPSLWQYTPDDEILHLLVRKGDLVEVAPGDVRTIDSMQVTTPYLEMNGEISFKAFFTDGTHGIVTARLIPEPAGLSILGASLLLLAPRARKLHHSVKYTLAGPTIRA